jgi:autotransporter-associated beta strand protein
MKITLAIILSLALVIPAFAGSATWNLNPISNDWNTAANWTPPTVPNGRNDRATFDFSNTTDVALSASSQVDRIIFNPGATPYTITVGPTDMTLTISGRGIGNNSGIAQNFFTANDELSHRGIIAFTGTASAGNATFTNEGGKIVFGGATQFFESSTADRGTFINNGGVITDGHNGQAGLTQFFDNATAAQGVFINNGATVKSTAGGHVEFYGNSTADRGTFTLNPGTTEGGAVFFDDNTTAGRALFAVNGATMPRDGGGFMQFLGNSTAGEAMIAINGSSGGGTGGVVYFLDDSAGGAAQITVSGNGLLVLTGHFSGPELAIGSLAGDGDVYLGNTQLIITSDQANTVYSGRMQDKLVGTSGSLAKEGVGSLTLAGSNIYTGGTSVNAGSLIVSNTIGSGTGSGPVQVDGGTLGGKGIIAGEVIIAAGAFLAPANGGTKPATLTIQSRITFQLSATYTYTFRQVAGSLRSDQLKCRGVTIDGASISILGTTEEPLPPGTTLTVINNTSGDPIVGTFSNLPDGAIVMVNGNNLQADYQGGDGNDLTLTVLP